MKEAVGESLVLSVWWGGCCQKGEIGVLVVVCLGGVSGRWVELERLRR